MFTWNIGKHFALYICWINITFMIVSVSVWIVSSIIMIEFCPPSSRVQSRKGLWGRGCREGWGNMNNAESLTVRLIILVWSSCTTVKAPCYCQVWQQFYIKRVGGPHFILIPVFFLFHMNYNFRLSVNTIRIKSFENKQQLGASRSGHSQWEEA